MADGKGTFERIEKKYMLNERQYREFLPILEAHMRQDSYGRHTIANIYYDTDDYALIRESIEKPKYKEKLRLRSYGTPKSDSKVFVELKKKVGGIVYKRRISLTLADACAFVDGDTSKNDTQIGRELSWFISKHELSAKVMLAYDRIAYFSDENSELRVTFDENIRWRSESVDLSMGTWGSALTSSGEHLMEIKIPGSIPLWLASALSELKIYPTSYSKYGECYKRNLKNKLDLGGVHCA